MTPEESRRDEAARWLGQARKDLNAARLLASAEPSRSTFHSQQAAEKAAKAFLAFHDVPFRKTHDLNELGGQCAALIPVPCSAVPGGIRSDRLRRSVPLFGAITYLTDQHFYRTIDLWTASIPSKTRLFSSEISKIARLS